MDKNKRGILLQIKRYKIFIGTLIVMGILFLINAEIGIKALDVTLFSFKEMILIIPPVFILLGLLDIWVPKETMVKYLGEDSGLKGKLLAIFLGSAAAGPLYGAFPVAGVFMKKGVKFSNILLFIGAWSTTKIPMVLFEINSLGIRFAMTRLAASMVGIFIIAAIANTFLNEKDINAIYKNANDMF